MAYHIVSCEGLTGGLKTTRVPVELMCMNWANNRLFVCEYCQQINTLIAVMARLKARKNGNQYAPCGADAPRKFTAGRCHRLHKRPKTIADLSGLHFKTIFG